MSTILISKNKIIENFNNLNNISTIHYPLKTNNNVLILKILNNIFTEHNKFLITNTEQFKVISNLTQVRNIYCINPLMSFNDILYLYKNGVKYFTFDNLDSIINFENNIETKNININIRLSISEIFNFDTHLGCSLKEFKEIINHIDNKYKTITLSFYLPDEIKKNKNSIEKMLNFIYENIEYKNIDFINIGGITTKNISKKLINEYKQKLNLKNIFIEPGYELLKNSSVLKNEIIRQKQINGKTILILENGIYSGLLDAKLYNKKFPIILKIKNGLIKLETEKNEYNNEILIYGSCCDTKDFIGKYFIDKKYISLLEQTEYVYIQNISSYFETLTTEYGKDVKINYILKEDFYEI